MPDRPNYLIIVTHKDRDGLELFSAHHDEEEANLMHERLSGLMGSSESVVHLVQVPEATGVAKGPVAPHVPRTARAKPKPAAQPSPAPSAAPFRRVTPAQFAAETQDLVQSLSNGGWRDADDPLEEGGAFS